MAAPVPGRRSVAEIAIALTLLGLGVGVVIGGRALAGASQAYAIIGPDLMPFLVGVGLVLVGAVLLWHALTGGYRNGEPDDAAARGDHPFIASAFLWVLGGLAAQMALMKTGGFVIAAAALFVCVARGFGSRHALRDTVTGLLIGLAVFFFFVHLLNVNLPAGLLTPLLGTAGI